MIRVFILGCHHHMVHMAANSVGMVGAIILKGCKNYGSVLHDCLDGVFLFLSEAATAS